MLKNMLIKTDGYSLIGRIKDKNPHNYRARGMRDPKSAKFDKYYYEGKEKGVKDRDLANYIQMRFMEDADDIINDSIDDKDFEILYKNFLNRLHKRLDRYRHKILMNEWTYFATFTYDDKKETRESFEKRLIICFNNFAKRNGWRVVGAWENGELNGRSHFHAFIYVPEGQMVGKMFKMSRWSYKKRKFEYYTDNSYFRERFGMSDWISVNKADILEGGLLSYLVKYVVKSGCKLFYSRGIPHEFEMDIDIDTQVMLSYYKHGVKHILMDVDQSYVILPDMSEFEHLFDNIDELPVLEGPGIGFCIDREKLVVVY